MQNLFLYFCRIYFCICADLFLYFSIDFCTPELISVFYIYVRNTRIGREDLREDEPSDRLPLLQQHFISVFLQNLFLYFCIDFCVLHLWRKDTLAERMSRVTDCPCSTIIWRSGGPRSRFSICEAIFCICICICICSTIICQSGGPRSMFSICEAIFCICICICLDCLLYAKF